MCYIFFMEHYMINVGKDLESQFCMSQLFSVIFFTFHCHKMLSLLAIRGPCWGVFSSLFNSMLSVFDFCFGASWLEINGSAFFNYRGNWSCHTPTSTIGTLEATSWFTYQAFWLGEAIYLMSSRSEDNLVQRSVGSQAVKHLKCREWNMGGNRETVEQDEWDVRLGCFPYTYFKICSTNGSIQQILQ